MQKEPRRAGLLILVGALTGVGGCAEVSEYRTEPGQVYRGTVIGTDDDPDGERAPSFIRRGFPAGTVLDMTFDPGASPVPGRLQTSGTSPVPIFEQTALEVMPPLAHDLLSQYDFPGSGRVRNYILIARPKKGPLSGRDATVFISLLDDGGVETRILARTESGCGEDMASPCDYFGVFRMARRDAPAKP